MAIDTQPITPVAAEAISPAALYLLLLRVEKGQDDGFAAVKESVAGVHDRLDALNGRTRRAENSIARLKAVVSIGSALALAWLIATLIK